MRVLIRQARLADPRSSHFGHEVDIYIEAGLIKTIAPHIDQPADQIISAPGLLAFPGWVDGFADYADPGYEHRESLSSGLAAAARGGFARVVLVPNTQPPLSKKSQLEYLYRQSQGQPVKIHPLGTLSQDAEGKTLAEMLDLHAGGAVGFTDGWEPVQNAALMVKALEYVHAFDGVIWQIPLEKNLSAGGLMHEGELSTYLGMPGIPAMAEALMVHRDLELLRYSQSRLHITGVSTEAGLRLIREAKAQGLAVTCSVTPYHLLFTDQALRTYNALYKVDPPLRSESDRQALIQGLVDGTVDAIASHHRPQDWDAKTREFAYAASGMNVQEMMVPVLWEALSPYLDLPRWAALLSLFWRGLLRLEEGRLEPGEKAEISLYSMDQVSRFTAEGLKSQSRNNPFMDKEYKGRVVGLINGEALYLNQD